MKNRRLLTLAGRLSDDLAQLERVVARIGQGWALNEQAESHFYLESVALNLHSFYVALERCFEAIAQGLDGWSSHGPGWHRELLLQMSRPIPGVRPAVIRKGTSRGLDEYRAFRHCQERVLF